MHKFTRFFVLFGVVMSLMVLSACGADDENLGEVDLEQRSSVNLIGLDVWLYIGDVERGRRVEDVVVEANDEAIASKDDMEVGDFLDFDYNGRGYRLTVTKLIDKSPTFGDPFPDDVAYFDFQRR